MRPLKSCGVFVFQFAFTAKSKKVFCSTAKSNHKRQAFRSSRLLLANPRPNIPSTIPGCADNNSIRRLFAVLPKKEANRRIRPHLLYFGAIREAGVYRFRLPPLRDASGAPRAHARGTSPRASSGETLRPSSAEAYPPSLRLRRIPSSHS